MEAARYPHGGSAKIRPMISAVKRRLHVALSPWIYRYPEPQLQADRLYLYLDTLYKTRHLSGTIVEIGCYQGGTAVYACRFLRRINCERHYICIDTFAGFPKSQFAEEVKLGTSASLADAFSVNSEAFVKKLLIQWGCPSIDLLKADVVTMDESILPDKIAVALIDVDIAEPTEAALRKIMPRMAQGGVILVDDCDLLPYKGARMATKKVAPHVQFKFGMGVVEMPANT